MGDIKLIWDGLRADFGLLQESVRRDSVALRLDAPSGNYARAEDAAAIGFGIATDARAWVALDSWVPGSKVAVLDRMADDASAFAFGVLADGRLWATVSEDGGGTGEEVDSTAVTPAPDGAAKWIRVVIDPAADTTFYTSDDGETWSQLGAAQATPTTPYPGDAPLTIGTGPVTGGQLVGAVLYAELRSGVDGTVVAQFDPAGHIGDSGFHAQTGELWELTGDGASIRHVQTTDELELPARDLRAEEGLETAVILSLFTDRRAGDGDALPDGSSDRRGWWGDALPVVDGDQVGSLLWLLQREKQSPAVLARAEQYARESLEWMVEDGVAESVAAVASSPRTGWLVLEVTITRPGPTPVTYKFDAAWAAQAGG